MRDLRDDGNYTLLDIHLVPDSIDGGGGTTAESVLVDDLPGDLPVSSTRVLADKPLDQFAPLISRSFFFTG